MQASWIHASEQSRRIEALQCELEKVQLQADIELGKARSLIWLLSVRYEQIYRDSPQTAAAEQLQQDECSARRERSRSSLLLGIISLTNFAIILFLIWDNWAELREMLLR